MIEKDCARLNPSEKLGYSNRVKLLFDIHVLSYELCQKRYLMQHPNHNSSEDQARTNGSSQSRHHIRPDQPI